MINRMMYLAGGMALSLLACTTGDQQLEDFPVLTGDFLGQELPGDSARIFAPGIVSTGMSNRDVAISPDGREIYFGASVGGFSYTTILVCRQVDGRWTAPEIAPFCRNPKTLYLEPAFTPDGNRLFFLSDMEDGGRGGEDIWYVEREDGAWGEPLNPGEPVNTAGSEFYPSFTTEGHLYFTRAEPGSQLNRIFRSRFIDGAFQEAELLPEQVNCGSNRFNAWISPEEDYIIVPALGMEDSYGGVDYYIVFRNKSDQWSEPLNMGSEINSDAMREWSASVSPDGKALFFMTNRLTGAGEWNYETLSGLHENPGNGNSDIYWISTGIIEQLRVRAEFR
jgi:hypothetical protein